MDEEDYWNVSMNKAFSFDDDNISDIPHSSSQSDRKLFDDGNTSELSYDITSNEIPLNLLISQADLLQVLEEQSAKETPLPKSITAEDELKHLRRQLQEKIHAPPPSVVVNKMIMKKQYYLQCFKSLEEKSNLLDEAIDSGDGDAILIVTLFLCGTLKQQLFVDILKTRPSAVNHYFNYLIGRREVLNNVDLLRSLGKQTEISMIMYKQAMENTDQRKKRENISFLYRDYFGHNEPNSFYSQLVLNYSNLLEWQQNECNSKELFDKSVLECLYWACSKSKWNTSNADNNLAMKLTEIHKIIPSQFEWVVLNERARSKAWLDLELIFQKKSWNQLKSKTLVMNIPLDKVILQLHRLDAPQAVLNHFLINITDPVHRAALALKVGAEKSVIDSYVELKEIQKLEQFVTGTLKPGSENRFYAENILKNWKTKGK